jgi:hypothetical protein
MHFVSNNQGGRHFHRLLFAAVIVAALGFQPHAHAAGPIQVMLLDGESGGPYHAWKLTTPAWPLLIRDAVSFREAALTRCTIQAVVPAS